MTSTLKENTVMSRLVLTLRGVKTGALCNLREKVSEVIGGRVGETHVITIYFLIEQNHFGLVTI